MDITSWNKFSNEQNISPVLLNINSGKEVLPKKVKLAGRPKKNAPTQKNKAAKTTKPKAKKPSKSTPKKTKSDSKKKKPASKSKSKSSKDELKGKEHLKYRKSSISLVSKSGKIVKNKTYKKFVVDIPTAKALKLFKEQS